MSFCLSKADSSIYDARLLGECPSSLLLLIRPSWVLCASVMLMRLGDLNALKMRLGWGGLLLNS